MTVATESYAENYSKLKGVAETLRSGEVDIDQLVPMVESAVAAYKVCKERIKAVQDMLGQTLPPEIAKV